VVHEVSNLADGVTAGELGGRKGDEGLDEGGLDGALELLLDLSEGGLGLLDLGKGSVTGLEGGEEGEGLVEGGDGLVVVDGLGLELGVLGLADVGLVGDVSLSLFDVSVKVSNVGLEVGLLDLEDVLKERGLVGDVGVGGIDLALDSLDIIVVLDGSLLVLLIGGGELAVKVVKDFLDGGDQLVQGALGHQVEFGKVDDDRRPSLVGLEGVHLVDLGVGHLVVDTNGAAGGDQQREANNGDNFHF